MERTGLGRRAWQTRRTAVRARTAAMRRAAVRARARANLIVAGVGLAAALVAVALAAQATLGRLGEPFALLLALPALARGLASFGLRDLLAARIAAVRTGERRLVAAYALWLATSALLTLDVAAVAAGSVAMSIGRSRAERRWQLGAAVVGSNVGSLLFPFSNLTNLVLVLASGIGLAGYLAASIPAQLAAAIAGGWLLTSRFLDEQESDRDDRPPLEDAPLPGPGRGRRPGEADRSQMLAGSLAAAVAVSAVVSGFGGGSMVWPFLAGAVIVVAWAVAAGRLDPRAVVRVTPVSGLLVIVLAAVATAPIAGLAGLVPRPHDASPLTLALVALAGGGLAVLVNNLPAAVLGAAWLGAAPAPVIVAYLIGTNFTALVTPHGSVATMLARSAARRRSRDTPIATYLGNAWRYATVTTAAAVVALILLR